MGNSIVLIADDDREIAMLISLTLEDEGYKTITVYNGQDVLNTLDKCEVDLIILDIMMPEIDGLEVCRRIRNSYKGPIVFLTAKGRELDRVIGLEVGADDYITKPFSVIELVARVNAHIRREKRLNSSVISSNMDTVKIDNLLLDLKAYEAFLDGIKIDVSTKEFQLLEYFAKNCGIVLTREQIYTGVWGSELYDTNIVTAHIKNLRNKMDNEGRFIKTIWGVGYKFINPGGVSK